MISELRAAGVVVTREGRNINLEGVERPSWFDRWAQKNMVYLAVMLPDQDHEPGMAGRRCFEDFDPRWDELSTGQRPDPRDWMPRRIVDPVQILNELFPIN